MNLAFDSRSRARFGPLTARPPRGSYQTVVLDATLTATARMDGYGRRRRRRD